MYQVPLVYESIPIACLTVGPCDACQMLWVWLKYKCLLGDVNMHGIYHTYVSVVPDLPSSFCIYIL